MKLSVVILFCILAEVLALTYIQKKNYYRGRCPKIAPMQDVVLKLFKGVWYDLHQYKTNFQNVNCNSTMDASSSHASVLISILTRISNATYTSQPVQRSWVLQGEENVTDGTFFLTLRDITAPNNVSISDFKGTYTTVYLDVNFTSITLVWSCITNSTNEMNNYQSLWVLRRQPKLSEVDMLIMSGLLGRFPNISADNLVTADGKICKGITKNPITVGESVWAQRRLPKLSAVDILTMNELLNRSPKISSDFLVIVNSQMCKNSTRDPFIDGCKNSSHQTAVNFVIVFLFSAVLFFSR